MCLVPEPPRVIQGPGRVEGHSGTEGTISCQASGTPAPVFNFFKVNIIKNKHSTGVSIYISVIYIILLPIVLINVVNGII